MQTDSGPSRKISRVVILILGFLGLLLIAIIVFSNINSLSASATLKALHLAKEPTPDPIKIAEEEAAYRDQIVTIMFDLAADAEVVSYFYDLVGNDVMLIHNDDLKSVVFESLDNIKDSIAQFRQLQPPAAYTECHAEMVLAIDALDQYVIEATTGINDLDADAVRRSTSLLAEATNHMEDALKLIPSPK